MRQMKKNQSRKWHGDTLQSYDGIFVREWTTYQGKQMRQSSVNTQLLIIEDGDILLLIRHMQNLSMELVLWYHHFHWSETCLFHVIVHRFQRLIRLPNNQIRSIMQGDKFNAYLFFRSSEEAYGKKREIHSIFMDADDRWSHLLSNIYSFPITYRADQSLDWWLFKKKLKWKFQSNLHWHLQKKKNWKKNVLTHLSTRFCSIIISPRNSNLIWISTFQQSRNIWMKRKYFFFVLFRFTSMYTV